MRAEGTRDRQQPQRKPPSIAGAGPISGRETQGIGDDPIILVLSQLLIVFISGNLPIQKILVC